MNESARETHLRGLLSAFGAYLLWGLLPLYWHALQDVSPFEVLAHRILWSVVFLVAVMSARGELSLFRRMLRVRRFLRVFLLSSVLLTYNWGLFIWAVQRGYMVECSFGYFMSPLITFFMGVVFLREPVRPAQIGALVLAAIGVAQIGLTFTALPWIALTLAVTFSFYTLLRRRLPAESVPALAIESMLMLPAAIGVLIYAYHQGELSFLHRSRSIDLLLLSAGAVTAYPLMLFTKAAKTLPFSTLGMIQYLSPSMQFLMGVTIFHETLEAPRLRAFVLVWIAIAIFSGEAWWRYRGRRVEVGA